MTPEEQIDAIVFATMEQAGQDIVADIGEEIGDAYPPSSDPGTPPHLRSGNLKAGLVYQVTQQGSVTILEVAATAEYAFYLEFGTPRMSARPFMFPAQYRWTPIITQRLSAAFTVQSVPAIASVFPDFSSIAAS